MWMQKIKKATISRCLFYIKKNVLPFYDQFLHISFFVVLDL